MLKFKWNIKMGKKNNISDDSELRDDKANWFEVIERQQQLKSPLVITEVCRIPSLNRQLVKP